MIRGSLPAAPLVLQTGLAELGVVAKDVISIRGRLDQCILEKHMNKAKIIKDIKKNQATEGDSSEMTTQVVLDCPYGKFHVGQKLDLLDHAAMRADQLSAMLLMIHTGGLDHFSSLNDNAQQSFLWLAFQLSTELVDMLPFMTIRSGVAS